MADLHKWGPSSIGIIWPPCLLVSLTVCTRSSDSKARFSIDAQVTGGLPDDSPEIPELPKVKGQTLKGGPQMIQLRFVTAAL